MYKLKELLVNENKRLKEFKQIVDERLIQAPEGTLEISSSNEQVQYLQCLGAERKRYYIPKSNLPLANKLAQKSYDNKVKRLVDRRLRQIDKLSKEYEDNEIEEIYNQLHPIRKGLIEPVIVSWEQCLAKWKSVPYVGKSFDKDVPEIYTRKGERVRSKSEKILADTFNDLGIEYKYECPITLRGFGTVYPDFTILRKRDRRVVYWEHDGRMDDPKYAEKAVRKINSYIANGIYPGDNLIVSFETSGVVINDKIIDQMINKYLL